MTCWGATTECLRNCCGGPHSEHYDAWLARERLRQLNAQTARVDQLTRENVVLGQALNQSQDILASYRDLDQYDTGSQPESRPSGPSNYPTPRPNYIAPVGAPAVAGLSRRGDSASIELPPVVQAVRREDLRVPAPTHYAAPPPATRSPSPPPPRSELHTAGPSLEGYVQPATPRMASPLRQRNAPAAAAVAAPVAVPVPPTPAAPSSAAMAAAERRVIMERLMAPLPQITARATIAPTPFADAPQQAVAAHPRTHGYAPRPPS